MTDDYSIPQVRATAGAGLDALYQIARADVRRRWHKMDVSARANACRGLVEMRHMANNPELHFSRDATFVRWHENAQAYVAKKSMIDLGSAMYLVDGPTDFALQLAGPALSGENMVPFRMLCNAIVNWEYECADYGIDGARALGRHVVDTSRQIINRTAVVLSCPIRRPIIRMRQHTR